jgi:hypothetical protein
MEEEIRKLLSIPTPAPAPPTSHDTFAADRMRENILDLEEKLKQMTDEKGQLEDKLEKIAITGDMDEEDKKKYRARTGVDKRVELTELPWNEMMERIKGIMATQKPDSPYHISKFKVDRFSKKEQEHSEIDGSTTEDDDE